MTATAMIDPLGVFMTRIEERAGARPLPLISTSFDVAIAAGLATVVTTRLFRNMEAAPIEAILTFPVPVHAAMFSLEARIDGRVLTATAQRREAARETYEAAIQEGKAAVLHEEVLRGIHTLSVANLRPGGEIELVVRWAATLAFVGGAGHLRIPLTAGQVYGSSGLNDSDELVADGRSGQRARLSIRNEDGAVSVANVSLDGGRADIPLDRPIDITTAAWKPVPLVGRAADGRRVELTLAPAPVGGGPASLAVLVDRSGSMSARFSATRYEMTNHEAAGAVIRGIAEALEEGDLLDLWEFSNSVRQVGSLSRFDRGSIDALLSWRMTPGGGTETGRALEAVAGRSEAGAILLITDGKSHALDVQALARLGRPVSVLLIGEDSLEARVGHLAALTGGELFIAGETNLGAVARAMVAAIRLPYAPSTPIASPLGELHARRAGVAITACWSDAPPPEAPEAGVSAVAAALALPALDEAGATSLAEAEGLVTHLTSLVLVDATGGIQEGLPLTRKVPLEMSAVAAGAPRVQRLARSRAAPEADRRAAACYEAPPAPAERCARPRPTDGNAALRALATLIDWGADGPALAGGDLSGLNAGVMELAEAAAVELRVYADRIGIAPVLLVIALAARIAGVANKTAMRVARALLGPLPAELLQPLLLSLGLGSNMAPTGSPMHR